MTTLYIVSGPCRGDYFELDGGTIYVGRASDNDIKINDNSISRRHLMIMKEDDRFFVEDLESKNRTLLDGRLIEPGERFEVQKGTQITIGNTVLHVADELAEDWEEGDHTHIHTAEIDVQDMAHFFKDRPQTLIRNMELVYKVSNVLMQSLNTTELFEKILDYLFDLLKRIDRGAILLTDSRTGEVEQVIARSKHGGPKNTLNYSRTIVNKVLNECKPVTMPDMRQEDLDDLSASMHLIRSVICVPLISKAQVRGAIYVDSLNMPHGFRKEDLLLLNALSSPAAVAIENAILYSDLEKIVDQRTAVLRETEKRLRESETRFKAIFDTMSSGVIVYEVIRDAEEFVILDLNKAARRIDKLRKKEASGKSARDIFPYFQDLGLFAAFKRVWQSGESEHHSVTLKGDENPESPTGWREYYIHCLSPNEIVTIYDDVTPQKKAEKEQKTLQKQLFVSQKMESIGAFAGGTAHNFRNILQAILGNIEYLEMAHGHEPEIKELAKSVYDSVERGVDLINNLLHFSKKGAKYQLVHLELGDVIQEAYEIIERVFDKNIKITLDIDEGLCVRGDHSLLSQVFMNLFTNARDAMPGGGKLLVQAKRMEDNVVTRVSDTGHGMDKATLEKIFDPFFTLKDVGKGTGLGLSTTHGIIDQHKGTITVSSEPGKGTCFEITLPAAEEIAVQRVAPQSEIILGKGEKVLIVDDEHAALEALTNLAQSLGYHAISVDRPRDALGNYLRWLPDVVLMDRNMPEMDGVTCIKEIMKANPEAKILIVSGYENSGSEGIDEDVKKLIKGYITKPCGREELGRTLSQVLQI